ncbi:MAG: N-acetyl-D-Glu racemase DgcA [Pseudomonadota bacterium]
MHSRSVTVRAHSAPLRTTFAISRGQKTKAETVRVEIRQVNAVGRGECVPYPRYRESVESVMGQIEAMRPALETGLDKVYLQTAMPAGAARCAIDCALWDLEAKMTGIPVWKRAGLATPNPVETAETVSLASPGEMADAASRVSGSLLKLKLGSGSDLACVEAVHRARPMARLILDGNEGIAADQLPGLCEAAADLGVVLIEQPLPSARDSKLQKSRYRIPICADESAHASADISELVPFYDSVNIKLDKAGGFTEALKMIAAARQAKMSVMMGCMVAGSLSMAPAVLLAQLADYADLDGPLWLAEDIENGLKYKGGWIEPPSTELWG